jgi:DNA-binding transcriptional ArsR family regulator
MEAAAKPCTPIEASGPETLALYALTSICPVGYIKRVESVFEIIAEPNRRAILSLLVSSQQSVGEIERQLRMPQPTVSKHLRVLREAGFVESTVDAQRRLYRLRPEPLQEVDAWLAPFRRFWSAHVDALERHLDRMDDFEPRTTASKRPVRSFESRTTASKRPVRSFESRTTASKRPVRSLTATKRKTRRRRRGANRERDNGETK